MITENFKSLVYFISNGKIKGYSTEILLEGLENTCGSKLNAYYLLEDCLNGISVDEFLSVFPIEKTYCRGEGIKDYYTSKRYVDTLKSSGELVLNHSNIHDFLWNVNLNEFWFEVMVNFFIMGINEEYESKTGMSMVDVFFNYKIYDKSKPRTKSSYLRVCK